MFEPHIANWPRNIIGPIGVWASIYVTLLQVFQPRAVIYHYTTCVLAMIYGPPLKACELTAMLYFHTTCVPADIYVSSLKVCQPRAMIYLYATFVLADIYVPLLKACQLRAVIYIYAPPQSVWTDNHDILHATCVPANTYRSPRAWFFLLHFCFSSHHVHYLRWVQFRSWTIGAHHNPTIDIHSLICHSCPHPHCFPW